MVKFDQKLCKEMFFKFLHTKAATAFSAS